MSDTENNYTTSELNDDDLLDLLTSSIHRKNIEDHIKELIKSHKKTKKKGYKKKRKLKKTRKNN